MPTDDQQLVPVFVPALSATLLSAEDKKGEPLTHDEVIRIRDKSPCIMLAVDDARKMDERRGYRDIDPENCWYDWQHLRRELGRKPDLDPGPKFDQVRSADADYQKTIQDARASLGRFREMLPDDGSPRFDAMVKTEVIEGDNRAFMWLLNTRTSGSGFVAEFFEIPPSLAPRKVGDSLQIAEESVMDWMVNDNGVLHGGYSIRYHRSQLPEDERADYDAYIGVTRYAELADQRDPDQAG